MVLVIRGHNSLKPISKPTQANCFKIVKGVHSGQFSPLNQSSEKKKEITNENVKRVSSSSVRLELTLIDKPVERGKIDKLERDCKHL